MKYVLQKFTSRKFLTALAGIITGIIVIVSGEVDKGVTSVIISVAAYLITEGVIDAKAVDMVDNVVEGTKQKLEENTDD